MKIGLFDPSLENNKGEPSINLGDLIIYEAVMKHLADVFPGAEYARVSSNVYPGKAELDSIKGCDYILIGGTNILSSDINVFNQWKIREQKYSRIFSSVPVKNVILMGVGWWQYQDSPTADTRAFYNRVLSKNYLHSTRDGYTAKMLEAINIKNVTNTSCPTAWELDGYDTNRKGNSPHCLFTLTDYMQDTVNDNALLGIIVENYTGDIYFFPQGTHDVEYINTLEVYKKNKSRVKILNRTMEDYVSCLSANGIDYIGTRLHAGIKALQLKKNTLIMIVDNRAKEMGKDILLPVVERYDHTTIKNWLKGEKLFSHIKLPLQEIAKWKKQFSL